MGVAECLRALEHLLLDHIEQLCGLLRNVVNLNLILFARVAAHQDALAALDVLRADLYAHRESAHLLVRKFVARAAVRVIHLRADAGSL